MEIATEYGEGTLGRRSVAVTIIVMAFMAILRKKFGHLTSVDGNLETTVCQLYVGADQTHWYGSDREHHGVDPDQHGGSGGYGGAQGHVDKS